MVTYNEIRKDKDVKAYIAAGNDVLEAIGYTEHGLAHCTLVAETAAKTLADLGYDERTCELAKIAGFMHDIGNMINRNNHAMSGAILTLEILKNRGMPADEAAAVATAIVHHDEPTAAAVSPIAAALILADKSDVRSTRVRDKKTIALDIHDRVNYAVHKSTLAIDAEKKVITLTLKINTDISPVMDYFEIFLQRMKLCREAAGFFGCGFCFVMNETRLL